jgi:hypothetical protein
MEADPRALSAGEIRIRIPATPVFASDLGIVGFFGLSMPALDAGSAKALAMQTQGGDAGPPGRGGDLCSPNRQAGQSL